MSKNRKFDDFDQYAKDYRSVHNRNIKISGADSDYFSEYKVVEVKKYFDHNQPLRILDLGCGDGNSAKYFVNYFPNSSIWGIDVSKKSIHIARQRNIPRCSFQEYNGEKIPFETCYFDIIFIAGVFHHVNKEYHEKILLECNRVLKSNGKLFVFEHNPLNPLTRKIVGECEFDADAELVTSKELVIAIKKTGFRMPKVNFTIFFPRTPFFKPLISLEKKLTWCPLGGQYYVKSEK